MKYIMSNENLKRGPGRPPKKKLHQSSVAKNGVAVKPMEPENLMELFYTDVYVFKKLNSYWAALQSKTITMYFTPKEIYFYNIEKDEEKTTKTVVEIFFDPKKMNHYYCAGEYEVNVKVVDLDIILQKVDKNSYNEIKFILTKNNETNQISINLNSEYEIPEFFEIEQLNMNKIGYYREMFDKIVDYKLEFTVKSKWLKKAIRDSKAFDKHWFIEKYGDSGNLIFSYQSQNKNVKAKLVPSDKANIDLKSKVKPGEIFSVSVFNDVISPTSNSLLSETVEVKASKDDPISLVYKINGDDICVKALISTVDYSQ